MLHAVSKVQQIVTHTIKDKNSHIVIKEVLNYLWQRVIKRSQALGSVISLVPSEINFQVSSHRTRRNKNQQKQNK